MRTFKGSFSTDVRIVVPDEFLNTLRHQAGIAEDIIEDGEVKVPKATPFLLQAQTMHPVNDDAFLEMVLANGIRHMVRNALVTELSYAGLGGSVAPLTINFVAQPRDENGLLVEFDAPTNPVTPEKTDD